MPRPLRDPDAFLKRLEWTVIRRLDGLLQGNYRTLFRGHGLDLAGLREYQHGDDVRHIDWNVTARLNTPYVREYHEDREINAWFLLDLSASVDFGARVKKQAVSAGFVTVLARLLTRQGNRVGAILYGAGIDNVIPARSGRRHVLHLLHALQSRPVLPASRRCAAAAKRRRKARSAVSTNNCSPVSASCITSIPMSGSSRSSGS